MFDPETNRLVIKEDRLWREYLASEPNSPESNRALRYFNQVKSQILSTLDRQEAEVIAIMGDLGRWS